jgi:hypothetical protein
MHNPITWGSLFGVGFIIVGLAGIVIGGTAIFAGGMSDAPEAGNSTSRTGCFILSAGFAVFALGIWCVR